LSVGIDLLVVKSYGDQFRAVLGSAFGSMAVLASGQAMAFLLQVLTARFLGSEAFGEYSFALAVLGVALILAKAGMDTMLVRTVSASVAEGKPELAVGAHRYSSRLVMRVGAIAGVVAAVAGIRFANTDSDSLQYALIVAAVAVPVAAFAELQAAVLRGFRAVLRALAGDYLVRPGVQLIVLLIVAFSGVVPLSPALVIGFYAVAALLSGIWLRSLVPVMVPGVRAAFSFDDRRRFLKGAFPLLLASGALSAMYAIDTVMLGFLASTRESGIYAAASRLALTVLFVMNAAQFVVAPRLAAAAATRDMRAMTEVVSTLNILSVLAGLVIGTALIPWAGPILGIFGGEFSQGGGVLQVLVFMQILNVLTGPVGTVLSMTGGERRLALLLALGLLANICLNIVLIPRYGSMGAAWSAFVAHALWNLAGLIHVRQRLGIDVSCLGLLRLRNGGRT
jgi:O-antigen/teichoic acid export membrane protein